MKITCCDRCKKETEDLKIINSHIELCKDCFNDFKEFMSQKPKTNKDKALFENLGRNAYEMIR